jgi:hypothetical protein
MWRCLNKLVEKFESYFLHLYEQSMNQIIQRLNATESYLDNDFKF